MIFSNPADWPRCQNLLLLSTNLLTWPTYRVTVNQYAKYLVILFENYCWLCDKLDCNNNTNIIYLKNHNWPFLLFIVEAWKLWFVSKIFNKSHILNIEIMLQESLNVSITWDVLGDVWPAQEMVVKPAVWACVCVCVCVAVAAAGGTSTSNMTDLLQVAGEVGKAVESLVTIMTDEEQQQHQNAAQQRPSSHW